MQEWSILVVVVLLATSKQRQTCRLSPRYYTSPSRILENPVLIRLGQFSPRKGCEDNSLCPIFDSHARARIPDLARNPRGFAIKFYTGEGNYDIVGLNFVSNSILWFDSWLT